MPDTAAPPAPSRHESILAGLLFAAALAFHAWSMSVGWEAKNLPGVEYRQAQTALSAYWIKQENNFSLAYPTPVLGKPWSVPMEFPLYQWTVVLTGKATGLGLTKAGRAVSIACFYLTLPGLFLLLGRWEVAWGRRWLVLALVVSCPFYIFYARAFLMETMALMFAVWFWVAFERAVKTRRPYWLALAVVAGTGAGLVKVTTFLLYLLPAGAWAAARLWRGRDTVRWRTDLGWMGAAVAVPFAAAIWWVWYADAVKALNPMADFLGSANLQDFNLGTMATRLSPKIWGMKWRIISEELTSPLVLVAGGIVLLLGARRRLRAALFCSLIFVAALWLFPVLYAYHDYYYVANAAALLLALGLGLVGLSESSRVGWAAPAVAFALMVAQMQYYRQHHYLSQEGTSRGGNVLSRVLREFTRPDEVIVVTGQDWNSMTAYYSQRRALMLRQDSESNEARILTALRQLEGEKIGALIIDGQPWQNLSALVRHLTKRGLAPLPWLAWDDVRVFLPQERWEEVVTLMRRGVIPEARWAAGAEPPPEQLGGRWHNMADMPLFTRDVFRTMNPRPVRFFSSFEPVLQGVGTELLFGAHPWTRLVFHLPRGTHRLRMSVWFNPGAYTPPLGESPTDGVEIAVSSLQAGGASQELVRWKVDPARNASDRYVVPVQFEFTLDQDGEVELVFDPGASGRDTRDWIWIRGPLVIE